MISYISLGKFNNSGLEVTEGSLYQAILFLEVYNQLAPQGMLG